jgi:ABC-type sugar transport system ATPase subunit
MNFLPVQADDGRLRAAGVALGVAARSGVARIGIRPEHVVVLPSGGDLTATVTLRETLGGDAYLYLRLADGQTMTVRADGDTPLDHGSEVGLTLPAQRIHQFAADGKALA